MDKVEFYLDDQLLGYSTVAPYTLRWTLAMSDVVPSYSLVPAPRITETLGAELSITEVISEEAVVTYLHQVQQGDLITSTQVISSSEELLYHMAWPDGRSIISDTLGYTETHTIHIKAFDAAGNEIESDGVEVQVIHKPEEEEEEPTAYGGALPLWRRPQANGRPVT